MPNIQIKNVPDAVHAVLKRRAGAAGQSLQEFMLGQVTSMSERPSWDELFSQIEQQTGGQISGQEAVAAIGEARGERDARPF
ncbi:MAG: hypothetical protein JHC87_09585 [Thermoleophilaceae bacterium]|nr:hypothetical protein [Thermoleophilaceae bacterium]